MNPSEIAWNADALGVVSKEHAISIQWLGTAGFKIEYQGATLLIDPYITRASLTASLLSRLVPDLKAITHWIPRADAIVVGHTHFDHALDVPTVARLTGARVFGSRSLQSLCLAYGVDARKIEVVEDKGSLGPIVREVGPFRLRFIPSVHAPVALGRIPFPGDITDCDQVPGRAHEYLCGAVFGIEIHVGGRTLFHLGSADLNDAELSTLHADLLLMGVAGWMVSRHVPERVVRKVDPAAVLLSHWDAFFFPMETRAKALPAMRTGGLVERLDRAARGVPIGTLALGGRLEMPART